MAGLLRRVALLLAFACAPALAQQVDQNFQALLTPLPDGTVEVTSFAAPVQRSAADAAMLIENARITLSNLGVEKPTGQQLGRALAGGTIDVPSGRTSLGGVLPQGTPGVTLNSQVINAANLPTVVNMSPAGVAPGQAAAGASAPPPNGGLAGSMASPQTPQSPIVSPLPPSSTATPPAGTPTPYIR